MQVLRLPASYPQPVKRVEAVETHMSWVFLTEQHAYKLKKPIATPLLDFTTVAARRAACEVELRLNRRLAADVYLAVVPIVEAAGVWRVEGEGAVIDWLVKMRRLPRELMLDARIEQGTVRPAEIDRLADTLIRFYAGVERAPEPGAAYGERLGRDIDAKRAALEHAHYALANDEIHAAASALERWHAAHGALLEARGASVVEAHGDLRPEHVCLEAEPVVIDCLEFDRSLRLLDPLSELSFLALECRRLGAPWIGQRVLERYLQQTALTSQHELLAFYQGYHALVRATVAIWHLDDDGLDHKARFRARAASYLRLARELLH
ncbi:MAG TPA: phosphotransferase [Polyangiales bacterium]|nr:phosphotransferase [Polyangiales bacterium]